MTRLTGFFAYPSQPPSVPATIKQARDSIHRQMRNVTINLWEDLSVAGKLIIEQLCNEISKSDFFCADLTGTNPNVLFELGYAIAQDKRVWLMLDTSRTESKHRFDQLQVLTTVGYSDYRNAEDVRVRFFKDAPYDDPRGSLFSRTLRPVIASEHRASGLFYLKNRHATEASRQISRKLEDGVVPVVVDDPFESTPQPLAWMAAKTYHALGVVAHLTSPDRDGAPLHNAKLALVAGMAFGWEKPLLLISEGDALAPLDYRDLLKRYRTPAEAVRYLNDWLEPLVLKWKQDSSSRSAQANKAKLKAELSELQVGEPVAENEAEQLVNEYFVDTAAYKDALRGGLSIFVGRKGSGKTANFLKLSSELSNRADVLTCVIKPPSYDIQGVVEMLRGIVQQDLKGYAIEALWKYLLLTEIAASLRSVIEAEQKQRSPTQEEAALLKYIARHEDDFHADFATRLERCLASVRAVQAEGDRESQRHSIAQRLHEERLPNIRDLVCGAIGGRRRVAVVIDNLDKAWDRQSELQYIPEVFLGLLSAASRVGDDMRRSSSRRTALELSFAIFVRSDIFERILAVAREPDKIKYSRLRWDDEQLLLRVLEERFSASQGGADPEKLWNRFFATRVRGVPVQRYILDAVLPRPRDIVYLVKSAVSIAINRGHGQVEADDIIQARTEYSQFAVESLLVEQAELRKLMEGVVYEFVGSAPVLGEQTIAAILRSAGVPNDQVFDMISRLCTLSFLGRETSPGEFRYSDDGGELRRIAVLARKLSEGQSAAEPQYQIHPAYHPFLEIDSAFKASEEG